MEPNEFIRFAEKLAARPDSQEASYRSAVSRAYYGAFHVAKQFLNAIGIAVPESAKGHGKVAIYLQQSGNASVREAGSLLDTLRSERLRADYELDDGTYQKQQNAMLRLENAHDIVRTVAACTPAHQVSIRMRIEAYIQQVGGM